MSTCPGSAMLTLGKLYDLSVSHFSYLQILRKDFVLVDADG